jgi:hypothetical protein
MADAFNATAARQLIAPKINMDFLIKNFLFTNTPILRRLNVEAAPLNNEKLHSEQWQQMVDAAKCD